MNDIKTQIENLDFNVKLYLNHSEIKQLENELLGKKENVITFNSKITYVITLCELKFQESTYADMNGIKLAQYMRLAGVKVPILFVSFLSRKMILDKHPDAEIICTPALKHGFWQLPSKPEEWIEKLNNLKGQLTNLELKYIQRRFYSIDGLLEQINHDISSCSTKEKLNEKLKILRFADKKKNYQSDIGDLETKINNGTENNLKEEKFRQDIYDSFKKICKQIKNATNGGSVNIKQQFDKNPHILFIDDDYNTDERIIKLVAEMKNQQFRVTTKSVPIYNLKEIDDGKNGRFDVVICDIEIKDRKADGIEELAYLGFNYIKWLERKNLDRIFIILSNVTRNLYNDIIFDNNNTKNVYPFQKDVYICSDAARQEFISKVKDLIDQKRNINSKNKGDFDENTVPLKYFRNYIGFLKEPSNYNGKKIPKQFNDYEDVKKYIEIKVEQLQATIDLSEPTFPQQNPKGTGDENGNNFAHFIHDKVGAIGDKKTEKPKDDKYTSTLSNNFINTLIARRLLIYTLLKSVSDIDVSALFENSQKQYPQTQYCFPSNISRQGITENKDNIKLFSSEEIVYIELLLNEKQEAKNSI
ncbi:MAG: hypothetical protein LBS55_07315 [Prevotellaceae bacterium]|nr:hypothetical protein [Prevotellaceae bacterium]